MFNTLLLWYNHSINFVLSLEGVRENGFDNTEKVLGNTILCI
jgi:hypothetical protein